MKQNKIKIAVTGGIGSGKSTVCKILKSLGYPVYSCDETYKKVLQDKNTLEELKDVFGEKIINLDGTLNRGALSELVFADEEKLNKLNSITHKKIFKKMFSDSEQEEGVIFFEVPLLFEGNYQNLFNDVLIIFRDKNDRINSVMARDGLKEEEVKIRLNKQYSYNQIDYVKYYVIHNDGNFDDLHTKINNFLADLKSKYSF